MLLRLATLHGPPRKSGAGRHVHPRLDTFYYRKSPIWAKRRRILRCTLRESLLVTNFKSANTVTFKLVNTSSQGSTLRTDRPRKCVADITELKCPYGVAVLTLISHRWIGGKVQRPGWVGTYRPGTGWLHPEPSSEQE